MNYNHSKPFIPSPPALPRFTMPNEGSEEADDPMDVAATAQRPALDASRARRVVRRSKPRVDATSEVQVEDILLEVYAEDPPPPTRRSLTTSAAPSLPSSQAKIAAAIAAVAPPPPSQSAAVDALLRASDPAFLPFGGYSPQPGRPQTQGAFAYPPTYGYSPDQDSPSVAPVAFPSAHMLAAGPVSVAPQATYAQARPTVAPRRRGGAAVAVWTVVLLVVGVGAGAGIAVGVRNGTFARLRDSAKAVAARGDAKPAAPAAAAPAPVVAEPASPVVAPAAPPAPAAPAPLPAVSVNSLPQPTIPADSTMVTFPASAQGHRVFFDGRPMAVTSEPVKLRCGRHMIRIGSTGKPRVTDLACGREVTLVR